MPAACANAGSAAAAGLACPLSQEGEAAVELQLSELLSQHRDFA